MVMPIEPYVLSASLSLPFRREQVIAFFAEAQNLAYFTGPNNHRHHTHTFTETVDDTLFDETTLDTEAYELRERDRKRAKKAIKDAREWLKDPTPLWARCTNWRFDICVGITPRRRRGATVMV